MARRAVAVVGGGMWGLALAAAAARTGPTMLYSRRAHDGQRPAGVSHAVDFAQIGRDARLILLAVPSEIARSVLRELGDHLDGRHIVVHGTRGLAGTDRLQTISQIVREETATRRIGALGGPVLASDLLDARPSVLVCGSHFPEVTAAVREALACPSARMDETDDLPGLEWASALVGCLAIGIGYAQARGVSAALVAALASRSVGEAAKIAAAAGGEEKTLLGLAGYGDLLACAGQSDRPEVLLGRVLGEGTPLAAALGAMKTRIEAVDLIPRVVAFGEERGVPCPIFRSLRDGVLGAHASDDLVRALMTAPA